MDSTFIRDRITATKAQIVAYEDAIAALTTGGMVSYSIDTGQTKNSVTKLDLDKLNAALDGLYNRCATLEARLTGGGTIVSRAGW